MSERDPSLTLNMGDGRKLEATPENTTLYTFLGRTAIGDVLFENSSVNHIYLGTGLDEEERPKGIYFFEKFSSVHEDIAKFAIEHSFPAILNQRTVPACDMEAYYLHVQQQEAHFAAQLNGVMPEDF